MNTQKSLENLRIKVFDNLDFIAVNNIESYTWALKSCFMKSDIIERKRMVDDLWFADSVEELLTKIYCAYEHIESQERKSDSTRVKHRLVLETYTDADCKDRPSMSINKEWVLKDS